MYIPGCGPMYIPTDLDFYFISIVGMTILVHLTLTMHPLCTCIAGCFIPVDVVLQEYHCQPQSVTTNHFNGLPILSV